MSKTLKEEYAEYLTRVKAKGVKTTFYTCPHCEKKIETPQPTKKDVSKKGYWDSTKICPECEKLAFVLVYPNGDTQAIEMVKN